ncbi:hypothetical protein K435DRAFT_803212 [Dendrothele bispora CBS 962.96]|uniref:Uncharacterized protein n=1 Tax=Dendrothele bispora (strain CBS 962.96) TaxID=1314807 RepID=A0A4S8LIB8_DENBC|nr:hypothetical protein K435DRAFT_803212 [Dendrothele bispora CBS 962.96]
MASTTSPNDCPSNVDPSMDSRPRVDRGSTGLEQAIGRERTLIADLDRLKADYNKLRLRIDSEVHNLTTANYALNQIIATARKDLQLVSDVAVRSFKNSDWAGNFTCLKSLKYY